MDAPSLPYVLITGASSGIGAQLALSFARRNYALILSGRDEPRLKAVAQEAQALYTASKSIPEIWIIPADLSKPSERLRLLETIASRPIDVQGLVNNAGFGLHGSAHTLSTAEQLALIEVNITALTHLSLHFLPLMRAKATGFILNVASVAGFVPGPHMAAYYASKAFVLSFSQALAYENKSAGVHISALCPGPTATDFGRRAGFSNTSVVDHYGVMSAQEVAEQGVRGVLDKQRITVTGWRNRFAVALIRFMPRSIVLKTIETAQRKRHKQP